MPAQKSAGSKTTLPMTVKNTGFLLDRLGEDCHPLQHLRELTTNSIEAILRTPQKIGEIVWDVDWVTHDLDGAYKLSIVDNGIGMTGDEMVEYINQLSSSVSEQSMSGNYGVGAKIATATRNHAGVMYLSWKDGLGSLIHLWRDPVSQAYGLKQFDAKDESYPYIAIEDEVKPDIVKDHGTKIILLGNVSTQNTMEAPPDTPSPSRWISKYLNTRYFRFPKGVTIRVREGWEYPRSDKDRNTLRTISGQERYLIDHSQSRGSVKLTGAVASWWILKDEPALGNNSGHIESSGHVAALYQDELYEIATGRSGSARLQNFGVIFGYRQVVIYVEPKSTHERRVTTNTARTALLLANEPLPWSDWAIEFREKMPEEIRSLVEQKAAASSVADHSKSIRERLKQILDLFKVSRYRPTIDGDVNIDPHVTSRGGQPRRDSAISSGAATTSPSGGEGGTAGGVYSIFQKDGGVPGKRVQSETFPEVQWISIKDGTRETGVLEDRAARFLVDQNTLLINADFRVFSDMVAKFLKDTGGSETLRDVIEDAVHGWFEQSLVETVIGVQALRNAKEWSLQDIEKALSEEALTSTVMPRYHVHNSVKRELGSRLGKFDLAASTN